MPPDGFDIVTRLETGEALVVSTKIKADKDRDLGSGGLLSWLLLSIRHRITADYGSSKQNKRVEKTRKNSAAKAEGHIYV
jgi:hypothetical protein